MRKFGSDMIACKNPLVVNEDEGEEFKKWEALVRWKPFIALDMTLAVGKKWNGTFP